MNIHLVGGFLGSGKTTAIRQACATLMAQGQKVAVITNDQGSQLIDSFVFRNERISQQQVGGGCFCCNYSQLEQHINTIANDYQPDHLFAEAVGTCTDLVATVIKPLQKFGAKETITLTTVVDAKLMIFMTQPHPPFEKNVEYIFFKQLEEAQLILLNKVDRVSSQELSTSRSFLNTHFPKALFIEQNSLNLTQRSPWLDQLLRANNFSDGSSLDIDYVRYAQGEALLGYLDQQLLVEADTPDAQEASVFLTDNFISRLKKIHAHVGHVKFWMNDKKLSYTATNEDGTACLETRPALSCELIVNARVQMDDLALKNLMEEAIVCTAEKFGVRIGVLASAHFKPGYPKPEYRIE